MVVVDFIEEIGRDIDRQGINGNFLSAGSGKGAAVQLGQLKPEIIGIMGITRNVNRLLIFFYRYEKSVLRTIQIKIINCITEISFIKRSGAGMLALSLYFGLVAANVANTAHIGGLTAGFILSMILYRKPKTAVISQETE